MGYLEGLLGLVSLQTVLVGTSVGLLTYYIYCKLKYKYPPGPWSLPLVGNFKIYTSEKMHRDIAELSKQYGPVVQISLGPMRAVFLNSLEVVIEALVKRKADFASRPRFHSGDMFTQGGKDIAFAPYNATWKFQKKVAGKALRYYMQGDNLEKMVSDVCEKVFERMSKETGPFIVTDYIDKLVIHMLYNMCFGRKCDLDSKDVNWILKLNLDSVDQFGKGFMEDIIPGMIYVYKTAKWKEFEKTSDELLLFIEKEVKEHKKTFDSSNIRDYCDSILLAREEAETEEREEDVAMLSDTYIVQIVSDIFFAGLDTTRMTLDWFINFMIEHPEYQEKCQQEIDQVIGKGESPSASDRSNLCFTEACIMETMRMGGVAAIGLPHSTICDTTVEILEKCRLSSMSMAGFSRKLEESKQSKKLQGCFTSLYTEQKKINIRRKKGGYDIPKGTMVFINHWALHYDANFWKDVEKFDPYRYLTKEGKMDMKPENWLPFSAGRRVCLGEPVARTELLLIASSFLQNFQFKVPPGVKHETRFRFPIAGTEVPEQYKVVVEKRNN